MKTSKAILLVLMAAAVLPAVAVSGENSFTDCVTTAAKTNASALTLDKVTECQQAR